MEGPWHTYLFYRFSYNTTCLFSNRMLGKHMSLDSGGGDGEIQAPSTRNEG